MMLSVGTKGTITAGPSKGKHGTIKQVGGYSVLLDDGKTVGPFWNESAL